MNQYLIGAIVGIIIGVGGVTLFHNETDDAMNHTHDETEAHLHSHTATDAGDFVAIAPDVKLAPISHASAVIQWGDQLIFADPVGDAATYNEFGTPDIVFITHRHGDHLDNENLPAILGDTTTLLAPQDVVDQLPEGIRATITVMNPGDTQTFGGLTFEAIPAYNLRAEAQNFHPQSWGDIGLIVSDEASRVYFPGDTEGTPEMLALQDIDAAFIAMNLPYTMSVEDAAAAVLAFAPKTVYPYHFRTPEGFSDVEQFTALIRDGNDAIEVIMLDWYTE